MLDEEAKLKIDSLTFEELSKNLALQYYGAMDSEKARYAQYIVDVKRRQESNLKIVNVVNSINDTGIKIATFIDKLIINMDKQVDKINQSNEKMAKAQERYLCLQVVMAGVLAVATIGLIYATWVK